MEGKFAFGGEGAKIPGTDFGLSFALFKIWLRPIGLNFKGYTAASNEGLLGAAIIESPVVDFVMRDLEEEEPFMNLHGLTVDITITSSIFIFNGGIATIKMIIRTNDATPAKELTFFSDQCKGASASIGDIHFVATLLELPVEEWDATSANVVPF